MSGTWLIWVSDPLANVLLGKGGEEGGIKQEEKESLHRKVRIDPRTSLKW